jgi:hypothetical protein
MTIDESRATPESITMVDHHFGGPWTEIKLDAVCYYLGCYTKALSRKQFDLWYVDGFAGTGDRTNEKLTGGLLERQPMKWVTETLPGSAKRAMNIRPPFKHFMCSSRLPGNRSWGARPPGRLATCQSRHAMLVNPRICFPLSGSISLSNRH